MLKKDERRRLVIFHGRPGSGKTELAKMLRAIFDSLWKENPKGIFDEKLSKWAAHISLLIYNEASIKVLFAPKNLDDMK